MRLFLVPFAILGIIAILGIGGCAARPGPQPGNATSSATPSDTPAISASASNSVEAAASPQREPAPPGLLVEMRAAAHPGYDRLVLEFGGQKPPPHRIRSVEEVRQDPTDKLIPLRGKRFIVIVIDGGTLDTTRTESDPAKARRYSGPQRITPDLPLIKEVAIAGDFEAVLSFGVGLSGETRVEVQELSSPARLVIDFRGR